MDSITSYLNLPITDPTWIFFVVLSIILLAPMILSKLRIPHIIGMILAGVLIGQHGFNILERDSSFELFGKVGIYYIMFLAGLEIDMAGFKRNRERGLAFGVITAVIPFAFGFIAGYYFLDYSIPASLLLSCMLSSHTLVAYPIVGRYGLSRDRSVTVSIAATLFALLASLLALAGISGMYKGSNDFGFWTLFVIKCAAYFVGMFILMPKVIRIFFRKYSDPVMQYIFVIAVVFFSAAMAEVSGLEGILGAFLAGLVLNRFIPQSSALMNRTEFVGNALFIPYFLIGVGMLVNLKPMFSQPNAILVVLIMVVAGTVSKLIAAKIAQRLFRFNKAEGMMMFGLTEGHAAGALAIVTVGMGLTFEGHQVMTNDVLDGVVMMILFSCIISSVATDQAARKMKLQADQGKEISPAVAHGDDEKILIPVCESADIHALMSTAVMMRNKSLNRGLICLNIVNDADMSQRTLDISNECLETAQRIAAAADVNVQTQRRLAVNFINGTVHAFRENDASEIIIGLHKPRGAKDSFLGSFTQGLVGCINRQLIIVDYKIPVNTIRCINVVVPERAEYEAGFHRWLDRVSRLANEVGCRLAFFSTEETSSKIRPYERMKYAGLRVEYHMIESWGELPSLGERVSADHMLVVVAARRGTISYQKQFHTLPEILHKHFSGVSLMLIYPEQYKGTMEDLTFAEPHGAAAPGESRVSAWLSKWVNKIG